MLALAVCANLGCTPADRPAGTPDRTDGMGRAPSPSAPPVPFPPDGKVFLGLQTNLGPYDFAAVDAFAGATRRHPSVLQFSQGWAADRFDAGVLDAIAGKGMLPIVSWEPWDYTQRGRAGSSGDQPAYRLARIINEQGRAQLGRSWGTAQAPDCAGFSLAQLQSLDFSRMDLTEFYAEIAPTLPDTGAMRSRAEQKVESYYKP